MAEDSEPEDHHKPAIVRVAQRLPRRGQRHLIKRLHAKMAFKPGNRQMGDPTDYTLQNKSQLKDVAVEQLATGDGERLETWYHKPAQKDGPVFVVFHGNKGHFGSVGDVRGDEDPQFRLELLKAIEKAGAGYVAVTLRGFGRSTGNPGEAGFSEDVKTVTDFIHQQNIDPKQVIAFGESMGGSVAAMLADHMTAKDQPPAMLCMVSGFTSLAKRIADDFPNLRTGEIDAVLDHKLNAEALLGRLSREHTFVYFAHAKADTTTAYHHTERLYQAALRHGLDAQIEMLPGHVRHINWDAAPIIKNALRIYQKRRSGEEFYTIGESDLPPAQTTGFREKLVPQTSGAPPEWER